MSVGIALGSNLGNSEEILKHSIEELKKIHQGNAATFLISSFFKTDPVDCPLASPMFLNAVIQLETTRTPWDLLDLLQAMEIQAGRLSPHAYHAPRTLDLDLLYYDSVTILTPRLQLPHPRIQERLFVLRPLVEINPHLILPGWHGNTEYYLRCLEKTFE